MVETISVDSQQEYFSQEGDGPYPEALARKVRRRRSELRLSQEDVREASGLSVTTIGKIERGDDDVRIQRATMRRLDAALDWPIGTCESVFEGREAPRAIGEDLQVIVEAAVARAVNERLLEDRLASAISVAGLPPEVARALDGLVVAIRNSVAHGV